LVWDHPRKQLTVRALRALDQPVRRIETAAQDVFTFGRVRDTQEWLQRLQAVSADEVRAVFGRMLQNPAAVALAGSVPARVRERAGALFAAGAVGEEG
jgi:predicted Zn-dependent peptidase